MKNLFFIIFIFSSLTIFAQVKVKKYNKAKFDNYELLFPMEWELNLTNSKTKVFHATLFDGLSTVVQMTIQNLNNSILTDSIGFKSNVEQIYESLKKQSSIELKIDSITESESTAQYKVIPPVGPTTFTYIKLLKFSKGIIFQKIIYIDKKDVSEKLNCKLRHGLTLITD